MYFGIKPIVDNEFTNNGQCTEHRTLIWYVDRGCGVVVKLPGEVKQIIYLTNMKNRLYGVTIGWL
jgi:hypothetical protein